MKCLKLASLTLVIAAMTATSSFAEKKLPVVASFSILGDLVSEVGGNRIALKTIVKANGDAHVYQPTPTDAKSVADAAIVFVNGAEFEGWIERLIKASGYKGPIVDATKGIKLLEAEHHDDDEHDKHDDDHKKGDKHAKSDNHKKGEKHDDHDKKEHASESGKKDDHHHHGEHDPHAWHDPTKVVAYVANIKDGLCKVDAAGCEMYTRNAAAYTQKLTALDAEIRKKLGSIVKSKRTIITSHDAFGYFSNAYGITILAPQGLSTESEASAADVAKLIDQIRKQGIKTVFVENVVDPRLIEQIARETGAKIGGKLYGDALSEPNGPAGTYLKMLRHNATLMAGALTGS